MLRTVTFNGICVKTNQDKDFLVFRKQWGKLLTSMFLSAASDRLPALIWKRIKGTKELYAFKRLFQEKGKLTLLL